MTELQHQQTVIKWSQQPLIRGEWPELKLLYHVPNERNCTPAQGEQLKRAGVKRGVPDLCLPIPKGDYHGLYIEMKTEVGKTSPDQDWWIEQLKMQGYYVGVCHGWRSAIKIIEWYMKLGGAE